MGVPLARYYVLSETGCCAKNLEWGADIDYGAARRVGPGGGVAVDGRWLGVGVPWGHGDGAHCEGLGGSQTLPRICTRCAPWKARLALRPHRENKYVGQFLPQSRQIRQPVRSNAPTVAVVSDWWDFGGLQTGRLWPRQYDFSVHFQGSNHEQE